MAARIYSNTNRIKFTDIPEKYSIPRQFRAKQSEVHSAVITYVVEHYRDTKKYRQKVVDALNRLTYCIVQNELPSFEWVSTDPINTMPDIDIDLVEAGIQGFFLTPEAIIWDVSPTDGFSDNIITSTVTNKDPKPAEIIVPQPEKSVLKPKATKKQNKPANIKNRPLHQIKEEQKFNRPS